MTRVIAPCRLHFGLMHVPGSCVWPSERRFGGVGLMIDQPGVVVTVRAASEWRLEGLLASRAQLFAQRFMAGLPAETRRPFHLLVERSPPEHVGLGVGTQLGLAVAKALAVECGQGNATAVELAQRVGRGERSAVGVHGFDHGGLIVETGKTPHEAISPLAQAVSLPRDWRVVVALASAATWSRWHGDRERSAFDRARPVDRSLSERLAAIAREQIVPAAQAGQLADFGRAVTTYNRLAGEPFVSDQGGIYASTAVARLIADLQGWGAAGVGQSSWGPAVFAFLPNDQQARDILERLRGPGGCAHAFASPINAHGAVVQDLSPHPHDM